MDVLRPSLRDFVLVMVACGGQPLPQDAKSCALSEALSEFYGDDFSTRTVPGAIGISFCIVLSVSCSVHRFKLVVPPQSVPFLAMRGSDTSSGFCDAFQVSSRLTLRPFLLTPRTSLAKSPLADDEYDFPRPCLWRSCFEFCRMPFHDGRPCHGCF